MGQLYPMKSSTVEQMYHIQIPGNVINRMWYRHITFDNGKPQLVAINILGEIVYRYKPIELRASDSQSVVLKQQFETEFLQHNYHYYMELFGIGKHQAKDACKCLERLGIITLHWFNIVDERGLHHSNVMHIELHVDRLIQISQAPTIEAPTDPAPEGNRESDHRADSDPVSDPISDPISDPDQPQSEGGCADLSAQGRDSNQGGCADLSAGVRGPIREGSADQTEGGARINPRRVRGSNLIPPRG